MTETSTEHRLDLLDLIGNYGNNPRVEHGDFTLTIVRGILTSRGMAVPTLEEVAPLVTQPLTMSGIDEIVTAHQAPPVKNSEQTLVLAAANYRDHKNSPVYLSELLSAFWENHRVPMGLSPSDVRLTECPYNDEDIWQFMKLDDPKPGNPDVDLGFYLPQALASKEDLLLLGKGFPEMGTWAFQNGNNIRNGHQQFGWMRVDASLDAPYRRNKKGELTGLNVDELKKAISDDKRTGETINIYGPSGKVIKSVFDYYPDQGSTWSRLPESLKGVKVLNAYFDSSGNLRVLSDWDHGRRGPDVGGRSLLGA